VHDIDEEAHSRSLRRASHVSTLGRDGLAGAFSSSTMNSAPLKSAVSVDVMRPEAVDNSSRGETHALRGRANRRNKRSPWFPRPPIPHRISPHGRWGPRLQRALSARH
jgi:hypothetical protein